MGKLLNSPYPPFVMRVLFSLRADMNTTADQTFTKIGTFGSYHITAVTGRNSTISITTAVGGIYSGAGKTGDIIIPASQVYSALLASQAGYFNSGPSLLAAAGAWPKTAAPILALSTPQGSAAAADFYVLGFSI